MTQLTMAGAIPQLTLGWRLKMALEHGRVSAQTMAEQLGVTRQTISRWCGDKGAPPAKAYLSQWALITGVPIDWIRNGVVPTDTGGDGGGSRVTGE